MSQASNNKKTNTPASAGKRKPKYSRVRMADPFFEREAEKYDYPLPSREYLLQLLGEAAGPMSGDDLADLLEIRDEELEHFARRLGAMEREGQLMRNRRGDFIVPDKADLIRGRVEGHPDGFGFLIPDDGSDDMFLGPRAMREVLHGDKVLVRAMGTDQRGRREAKIVEVLERANSKVVGRVVVEQGVAFFAAENRRLNQHILLTPPTGRNKPKDGQVVTVEITQQPTAYSQPIGRIVETLGNYADSGMEIEIALRKHDLPFDFSPETEAEAKKLPSRVLKKDWGPGREDIRQLPLVTIDGETARDFDDAVYCERDGKGFRLLVAIADVSHYVTPGSALDADGLARGNSVYFPRRVIPMLPEKLSNGLCSLNPDVERLCMVCDMSISNAGVVKEYRFYPAVMFSHARLTYTKVAAMLYEGDGDLREEHARLLPHLENLDALFRVLLKARAKRGAIEFETVETKMVFDEQGKIERIVPERRNDAHRLIEECMLAANVCASDFLQKHEHPALYRVHEGPTAEKLGKLREFLAEFGISLAGGDNPRASDFAKVVDQIKERPDAQLIQTVMLRSLQQAVYSPDNVGHFGLAYEAYTHFTSPIRRYPDLLVHRAIKAVLTRRIYNPDRGPVELLMDTRRRRRVPDQKGPAGKGRGKPEAARAPEVPAKVKSGGIWEDIGVHCSQTERRADEASRDVETWLKCYYMQDRVGEEYVGSITAVVSFGIFVTLDELFVEGLVHISELGKDYFHFDEGRHELLGERTGERFRLSERVRVQVVRVDLESRKIDFRLIEGVTRETTRVGKTDKDAARRQAPREPEPVPVPKAKTKEREKGMAKVEVAVPARPARAPQKAALLTPPSRPAKDVGLAKSARKDLATPARDDDDEVVSWRELAGLPPRKGPPPVADIAPAKTRGGAPQGGHKQAQSASAHSPSKPAVKKKTPASPSAAKRPVKGDRRG